MKNFIFTGLLVSAVTFSTYAQHKFTLNLSDIADDQFKVTVIPDGLTNRNNIFQFAAIAPGTYQTMDIGRFVRAFAAFDANGDTLGSSQLSTNQWKLSEPEKTSRIEYAIAETWDNPVTEHVVYNMCGTSLEKDHAYINNHAVLGYFHGMQSHELWIKINHPVDWVAGTALSMNAEGYYTAPSYDFAVDSPLMLGRLTKASTDVEGTLVDIFTYSKTDLIKSEDILTDLKDILFAASKFTEGLPVDRYVFLYHFEDMDYGAWEHSYSSSYAMREAPFDEARTLQFRSIAAHEFYHVVTPLNIHSELIEKFNYEEPELSQHLWLYEGVTEWAAMALLLRDNIISLDEYLAETTQKLSTNDGFDPNLSLTELGINATHMQDQYVNIYMKGAVTAAMLDLLLLKKSKGKSGLRELVNDLSKKYGPSKPFDEEGFFDELVAATYPDVGDFIEKHIQGAEKLPLKEYFGFIGINYQEIAGYDSSKVSLGIGLTVEGMDIVVANANENFKEIKKGDILKSVDGVEISLMNAQIEFTKFQSRKPGENVKFTFLRDEELIEVEMILQPQRIMHQFQVIEKPKKKQAKLRKKWLKNS